MWGATITVDPSAAGDFLCGLVHPLGQFLPPFGKHATQAASSCSPPCCLQPKLHEVLRPRVHSRAA